MNTGLTLLKGAVLLVGLLVAGLLGACGYQYLALNGAERNIAAQAAAKRRTEKQVAAQEKAHDTALHLATYITRRDTAWTWSEQLPEMVTQLEAVTQKTGAVIDTLQPAPPMGKTALVRYPLRVTLHASLADLTKVLKRLRAATPVLAVDGITVRAGLKAADPLQVDLTLSAYVLLEHQAEGGDA
jgi:Tfp pilus assembly protein PilO